MDIYFDLQEFLEDAPLGEMAGGRVLRPYGESPPAIVVEEADEARVLRVIRRSPYGHGLLFDIPALGDIGEDCGLIVVGRLCDVSAPPGTAAVLDALCGGPAGTGEPFGGIYAMHSVDWELVKGGVCITTKKSGQYVWGFDFHVDGILVVGRRHFSE